MEVREIKRSGGLGHLTSGCGGEGDQRVWNSLPLAVEERVIRGSGIWLWREV